MVILIEALAFKDKYLFKVFSVAFWELYNSREKPNKFGRGHVDQSMRSGAILLIVHFQLRFMIKYNLKFIQAGKVLKNFDVAAKKSEIPFFSYSIEG